MKENLNDQKRRIRLEGDKRKMFVVTIQLPEVYIDYINIQKKKGLCKSRSKYIYEAVADFLKTERKISNQILEYNNNNQLNEKGVLL